MLVHLKKKCCQHWNRQQFKKIGIGQASDNTFQSVFVTHHLVLFVSCSFAARGCRWAPRQALWRSLRWTARRSLRCSSRQFAPQSSWFDQTGMSSKTHLYSASVQMIYTMIYYHEHRLWSKYFADQLHKGSCQFSWQQFIVVRYS